MKSTGSAPRSVKRVTTRRSRSGLTFVALVGIILSALFLGQPGNAVQASLDHTSAPAPSGSPPPQIPLSTERLKQLLLARGLTDVVAHLRTRVETPLPTQPVVYWTIVDGQSPNWGGYVADQGNTGNWVNESRAFFHVRQVTGGPAVGTWGGVGGVNGTNLAQTGVDQLRMQAWVELFPNPATYLFSIGNGDTMFSNVFFDGATGGWVLLIQDYTSGTFFSQEYVFTPDLTSADFISEAQGGGPVPSFSGIDFSSSGYFINQLGTELTIDNPYSLRTIRLKLVSPYGGCITPSALTADGRGFTNFWGC